MLDRTCIQGMYHSICTQTIAELSHSVWSQLFFCRTRVQLRRRESSSSKRHLLSPADNINGQNQKRPQLNTRVTKKKKATLKCVKKIGFGHLQGEDTRPDYPPFPPAFFYLAPNSAIELPNSDPLALNFEDTCTLFLQHHTQPCRALWSAFEINDFHFYHFFKLRGPPGDIAYMGFVGDDLTIPHSFSQFYS